MRLLSSLRSRIFLTSALLAVLSIAVAIYLVSVRVTTEHENALQREISATGRLVDELRTTRAQNYTTMARLIADAPKLKAAVSTNDPPTVQGPAAEYQKLLNSNLLLVTDKGGKVLATVGVSDRVAAVVASQPAVRNAALGRESFSLLPQPDGMLQLVTVPISIGLTNPDILGTLSVGVLLDDKLAAQTKAITGSEIAFGMDGQILASTLPAADRGLLSELLRTAEPGQTVTLHQEDYAVLPISLTPGGEAGDAGAGPMALVLRSRSEQQHLLRTLHLQLVVAALAALFPAMLLSFAVARTITRPLAAITGAMREVAETGDLTRKIALGGARRWEDEDATLLATTFNTLTDSIARFQREMSQRERLSALGRLSTVIAHEVRNPLMIIKAALHTLRQPDLTPAAIREAASDIDEEVARLNRVVNDVLDFARPIHYELSLTDLNALCRDAAEAAQAAPGPAVRVEVDEAVSPLTTDAERLRLALVNLIVNARQAVETQDGVHGGTPGVMLSTRAAASGATIVVSDNGVGIKPADLPRVFDPYFTTKRGGTGLGLPIAKTIVEGLGGTIAVASAPGRGTEIRIDLPFDGQPPPIHTPPVAAADAHDRQRAR